VFSEVGCVIREDLTRHLEYQAALVGGEAERSAVFAIRLQVFVVEQNVPPAEEWDEFDLTATHFLVRRLRLSASPVPEDIIGTARLIDMGKQIGKVGRVAILPEHRGRGAGSCLMYFVEGTARSHGFSRLALDAQCLAIPFYARLGYVAHGPVFLDADIEHRHMTKTL